jgi:hypothetical protein
MEARFTARMDGFMAKISHGAGGGGRGNGIGGGGGNGGGGNAGAGKGGKGGKGAKAACFRHLHKGQCERTGCPFDHAGPAGTVRCPDIATCTRGQKCIYSHV